MTLAALAPENYHKNTLAADAGNDWFYLRIFNEKMQRIKLWTSFFQEFVVELSLRACCWYWGNVHPNKLWPFPTARGVCILHDHILRCSPHPKIPVTIRIIILWGGNQRSQSKLGGGNSNIFSFHPYHPWGNHDPIWLAHIFQSWLVKIHQLVTGLCLLMSKWATDDNFPY